MITYEVHFWNCPCHLYVPLKHIYLICLYKKVFSLMSWKLAMWYHCWNVIIQNYSIIIDQCMRYALRQRSLRKLCTIGCEAFLMNTNPLFSYQFGFRKSHSTYMALMTLMDNLINFLDNGEYVIGIFLDFSKAFDTVDHGILLQKLSSYGFVGKLCFGFKVIFLTDMSSWHTMGCLLKRKK